MKTLHAFRIAPGGVPLAALALAAGCSGAPAAQPAELPDPAPAAVPEAPTAENARERHLEVHWVRSAAEYRALTTQIFRAAGDVLRERAAGLERGSWAVIVDGDETILDNSEFQRRIAETGQSYSDSLWAVWVREEAATAVPGARGFVRLVQELGGRVAVVTNRAAPLCPATRRNLAALGMDVAVILCKTDTSQKEARFRAVEEGRAAAGLPPLEPVMWIGDNVGDFPTVDQSLRDAPATALRPFGRRFFVLPNPMYGSWVSNEWR